MPYDPENNPRWLGEPLEEAEIPPQLTEDAANIEIVTAALRRVTGDDWNFFASLLKGEIDRAKNAALNVRDLGELRELSGKVRAFEWMLQLPTNLRSQQIRSLEAQQEIARLTSE
jgi:hypothetical protein